MHVTCVAFFISLIFGATVQLPQDGGQEKVNTSVKTGAAVTDAVNVTTTTTTEVPIHCETVRKIKGLCVIRAQCDFGPGEIDFTLYESRAYRRPCRIGSVCCPYQFQQPIKEQKNELENFDFDDDD